MVGAQCHVRTACGLEAGITDRRIATGRSIPNPPVRCWFQSQSQSQFQFHTSIPLEFKTILPLWCHARHPPKSLLISCKSSRGSSSGGGPSTNAHHDHDHGHDYLQASILVAGPSPSTSSYEKIEWIVYLFPFKYLFRYFFVLFNYYYYYF